MKELHPQNKRYGAFGKHKSPKLRTFQRGVRSALRGVEFISRREWSRRRRQNPAAPCTHILDRRLRRAMREIQPERNYVVRRGSPKAAAKPKKTSRQNSAAKMAAMLGFAASAMAQRPESALPERRR